jgi:hypothetical protein
MPATPVQPAFGGNRLVDAAFTPASRNRHDGCLPAAGKSDLIDVMHSAVIRS